MILGWRSHGVSRVVTRNVPAGTTVVGNPVKIAAREKQLTDRKDKILREAEFGRLWLAGHYFCPYGFQ